VIAITPAVDTVVVSQEVTNQVKNWSAFRSIFNGFAGI
jgi:hypothetical protein